MYRIVTKYQLFGLRKEHDAAHQHNHMMLRPVAGIPEAFDTEQAAFDWALSNHEDLRHHPEFVVLPVHHMVLTWQPEDAPL